VRRRALDRRPVDLRHAYGGKRRGILTAFANALLLLVAMGAPAWDAFRNGRCGAYPSSQGTNAHLGIRRVVMWRSALAGSVSGSLLSVVNRRE
jgi:hypothetical protein